MIPLRTLACLLLLLAGAAGAADPNEALRAAMREAQARKSAIFVDFHAPWCYSCYYMSQHVLTGPEWDALRQRLVVLPFDADTPEGHYWMEAWNVKVLPTYLVLTPQAEELGRVLGEQTRANFYAQVNALAVRSDTLDALIDKVQDDGPASMAAAREVLEAFQARQDASGGLDWFVRLPPAWRAELIRDPAAALAVARLELLRAQGERDAEACAKAGRAVLSAELGCERPYELSRVLACTANWQAERRAALLQPEVAPMEALLQGRVFTEGERCADERSIVLTAASLYAALGQSRQESRLLKRAIKDVQARLGDEVAADRNLADNLRVYLERAGEHKALDRLFQRLMAAYPNDYVYAYRHGKSLAARGQHGAALPLFALAARQAYGVNRMQVAAAWARSYQALGRTLDAQLVLGNVLREEGAWFPQAAAELRSLQDEIRQARAPG